MQTPPVALMEAAAFTLGCAAIHDLRAHAARMTKVLLAALVVLTLVSVTMDSLTYGGTADEYDLLSALGQTP